MRSLPTLRLTHAQKRWLSRGLSQPGGKLPLFDEDGTKVSSRTIASCVNHGWAEPWFANPLKPEWLVCRLTEAGRKIIQGAQS
ncbi:MAG: hypothetical protein CMM33_05650 [Rhodospirillaceae bacterium]|nr:hypothetical protein [Rhodospirillaceae bacterium]